MHGDGSRAVAAKTLGFFTRLLDDASAGERYRLVTEQIVHAEKLGLETAWVAQHHFDASEGGLPSPFPFLAHVAAHTTCIRLGTGIVTLPLENPVRVAEDAAVVNLLSGGRLELGLGSGGNPSSFPAFGQENARRGEIFGQNLHVLLAALRGENLGHDNNRLYPAAPQLLDRIWLATFSADGGRQAGQAGHGLMLSRTQPRSPAAPHASLMHIQHPIIDAYLKALPAGRVPRILASRSVIVADDRKEAMRFAEIGLCRFIRRAGKGEWVAPGSSVDELIAAFDVHIGTPDEVAESLRADSTLDRVSDVVVQVHSVDPPHPFILRSIELFTHDVAPALGWVKTKLRLSKNHPVDI
jgi:putative FMN-dependent luciferase-like monooxygenase